MNLPPSLRLEVTKLTQDKLIKSIIFFRGKNPLFLSKIIPELRGRSFYPGELLYSEGDTAEEIYFIYVGNFRLFKDMSKLLPLPEGTIDLKTQAFNVPYSTYSSGSYFGD